MKKLIVAILSLVLLLGHARSAEKIAPPPDGSVWTMFNSSYWTLGSVGCYIYAGQALYWNTNHLQQWQNNRSGGSLLEATERQAKYGTAECGHVAGSGKVYVEIWSDNNGGYSPSAWHTDFLKFIGAPGLLWDGSTYSDPGGIVGAQAGTYRYFIGGSIPVGPAAGSHYATGSADQLLDAQAQADGAASAYLSFGNFYYLNSYANWTNDILNGTKLREVSFPFGATPDEEHPGTSGAFAMAVNALQNRLDTNVWTAVIDGASATATTTNHCTASVSKVDNDITVSVTPDRYSMPFHMPDAATGRTNTCAPAFVLQPGFSNAFYEVICFQNIPDGVWQVSEDGTNILQCTSAVLRGGLNWFAICKGTDWDKRVHVLDLYLTRYGYNYLTLEVSNGGTAFGEQRWQSGCQAIWDDGDRGDNLINALQSEWATIHAVDVTIWAAAAPQTHVMKFTLLSQNGTNYRLRKT